MWSIKRIGRGWRNLSIFKKVLVSMMLIFSFNITLMLIWEKHEDRKQEVEHYEKSLFYTENLLLNCIKYSNEFIISDLRDTNFFKKGVSKNSISFDKTMDELEVKLDLLRDKPLSSEFKVKNNIEQYISLVEVMKSNHNLLIKLTLTKGFYDFGLEGDLREQIHAIEDVYSGHIGLPDVLELRRIEKDYLLRRQDFYVEKFQMKIAEIVNAKKDMENDSLNMSMLHLKKYNQLFLKLVKTTKLIYDEESGMLSTLNANLDLLDVKLMDLKYAILINSKAKLSTLRQYYWAVTLIFVVISVLLIFFIAKELTTPIKRLNRGVMRFIESNFEVITYPVYKNRKDELGILGNNFLKLQKEIGETFKDYRIASEKKQSKLQRQNEKIEIQKFLIAEHRATLQEKNKSLHDSLTYALRIQNNLMLSRDDLYRSDLKIHSIFKPKDVVSGDFYWFYENESDIYLSLADCTGHGVPGAFMSILGISFLNAAVTELNIFEPNEILEFINNKIIGTLNADNVADGLRDSIDMVLIKISKQNLKVTISSANKDFVLIKDGIIERVKNSRCSVGSSRLYNVKNNLYENTNINVHDIDAIYLYSDGIIDQFSADTNKKFKFKRFEKILKESDTISSAVANVGHTLSKWQGNAEQTDDISLLGIDFKHFAKVMSFQVENKETVKSA